VIGPASTLSFQGKTALVTGASSGIGDAFAEELAKRGCNLVLASRSLEVLQATSRRLGGDYGVRVEALRVDLTLPGDRAGLINACADRVIDVLINNAGLGLQGSFARLPVEAQLGLVELNCAAIVDLSHAFLPGMLARGIGGILNVASTAAFQSTPMMATYGATKAFVLSVSQAIAVEARRSGVKVLALCPGPMATNFSQGFSDEQLGDRVFAHAPSAGSIVPAALDALAAGRTLYIPGGANRLGAFAPRLLPRSLVAAIAGRYLQ
jgi:short-subunit dehydrogenase